MRAPHRTIALALLALSAAGVVRAQPVTPRPQQKQVFTPTRTAKQFGELERDVAAAVKAHDTAALDKLLLDDFEMVSSAHPDQPAGREDWQDAMLASPPKAYRVDSVSVRLAGADAAVVTLGYEQD